MKIRTLAACAVLAASSLAVAQPINDSFMYQGTLNDNGAPANGLYDIIFQIHQTESGGTASFSLAVNNIEVTDGLFEAYVNFALSGVVFDTDQTRWLELRVTEAGQPGVTILAPRQRITPAPLANYALRAGHADSADTSLQDAYDNGEIITFNSTQGSIEFHSGPSQNAGLIITNELHETRAFYGKAASDSGILVLYNQDGNATIRLEPDVSAGGGGFVQVSRNNTGTGGVIIDGNHSNTEASFLSVAGPQRTITLDTSVAGDDSVILPADSINSTESINEVGVAETTSNVATELTANSSVIDNIASVTINAPSAGYVLVIASIELSAAHVAGSTTSIDIGVSTDATTISFNGDLETRLGSTVPSGSFDHAVTVHSVFSAVEGSNTYYLNGNLRTGAATAITYDTQLSAIFIPTAYGSAAIQNGPNVPDEFTPVRGPQTQYDIVIEQNAALQADLTRQQRELDVMKAQMQQLLIEAQNDPQQSQRDK